MAGAVVLAAVTTLLLLERDRPASIQLTVPQPMIFDAESFKPAVKIKNRRGAILSEARFSVSATPAEIVSVDRDGNIRCARRGDATVTAAAGEVSASIVIQCRPIGSVSGPSEMILMVGAKPLDTHERIAVLDDTGTPHTDVPVALRSENEAVFKVEGERIAPVAIGSAVLTVSGGDESVSLPVSVVESSVVRDATVAGASRLELQLAAGSYRVQLKPGDSQSATFAVAFAGASCEAQDELAAYDQRCSFPEGGSMTIRTNAGRPLPLHISIERAP